MCNNYFTMENNFINWLEVELRNRGWSRAELARRANLNQSSLSMIWSGQRKPGNDLCEAIAHALGYPPETVYRAAGLLPPADEITEAVSQLNHAYKQLSPRDQEEVLDIIRVKLERAKLEQERQRSAKRIKTGPLPGLGG